MISNDNLSIYGDGFQKQLIYEILTNYSFGLDIIDVLSPNYFSDKSYINLIKLIYNYYDKHGAIPTLEDIDIEIESSPLVDKESVTYEQLKDTLSDIVKSNYTNQNVKERAIGFCKVKKLYSYVADTKVKLEKNVDYENFESYEKEFNRQFSRVEGVNHSDVFDDIDNTLSEDFRKPIPTGVKGIDEITGGGLSKGELALLIAPLGVGKTTTLTKIANTAYSEGKNVIQFVFEDKPKIIRRKHYTVWTGVGLDKLDKSGFVNDVKRRIRNIKNKVNSGTNYMEIIKLPADGVTVDKIKNIIKKLTIQKGAPELVTIDYIDCINPEKVIGRDEWSSDGKIMRKLETICEELNFACWAATQGNRESTTATQITADKGGGSIKKSQIAHLVIGIAKTMEQKEADKATISIIKNRFGDDGMIYENCVFKNKVMHISTMNKARTVNEISSRRNNSTSDAVRSFQEAQNEYSQMEST